MSNFKELMKINIKLQNILNSKKSNSRFLKEKTSSKKIKKYFYCINSDNETKKIRKLLNSKKDYYLQFSRKQFIYREWNGYANF
jgi:uncharacterized protein (DUF1015 family)